MGPQSPWPQVGTEVVLENSEFRQGGGAGNTALALNALGCPFILLANMGRDFMGHWLADQFGPMALDWTYCDLPTTFSVGITHPDGERTFFTNQGHLSGFRWQDVSAKLDQQNIEDAVILFTGVFLLANLMGDFERILPELRSKGARIALDTGWPQEGWSKQVRQKVLDWLPHCDDVLFNEAEVCGLFDCADGDLSKAATAMKTHMPEKSVLVVKRGPEGASAWGEHGALHCPGKCVRVIDTIGAGDCFNAGYLMARSAGADIEAALQKGVEVASLAISTHPKRYC